MSTNIQTNVCTGASWRQTFESWNTENREVGDRRFSFAENASVSMFSAKVVPEIFKRGNYHAALIGYASASFALRRLT